MSPFRFAVLLASAAYLVFSPATIFGSVPGVSALAVPAAVPADGARLDRRRTTNVNAGAAANLAGNVQNALATGQCAPMTVIFARGTTEQGNVGNLVGPPLFMAIEGMVGAGNAAFQGVDYPADVAGFLAGGDPNGSMKMAALVMQAMADCPNTKVVMAGYSQGGQLVHNAADMLPPAVTAQVSAALIFGDPNNGAPVTGVDPAKTMVICHQNDNICQHGATILPAHLTYGTMNAAEGAAFVVQAAGMA